MVTTTHREPAPPDPAPAAGGSATRPRIAFLSYSSGQFDARTQRMARSAIDAGYEVVVYARSEGGLPLLEQHEGYQLVRVPYGIRLLVPLLRRRGLRRATKVAAVHAETLTSRLDAVASERDDEMPDDEDVEDANALVAVHVGPPVRGVRPPASLARRLLRALIARPRRLAKRLFATMLIFPLRPMGWAVGLEAVAQPADIWHGMWAGSLPALARLSARHGGRTIYDSRDVYTQSRRFGTMPSWRRRIYAALERRWVREVDVVITVNDAYADILARILRIPRPPIVMNCPERWTPPTPRPDHIRAALALPAAERVVLYQGNLISERGIEQSMDAILAVADARLVLMGPGTERARYEALAESPPYAARVSVLPPVPPSELLEWTASADVLVMAIQPTTVNHRFTTPQKLFEALAAGVPVVASDLPGMAPIVHATGAGVLVDPTDPASIASGIRSILDAPEAERSAYATRALSAAHDRYNWETQEGELVAIWSRLVPVATA